MPRWVCVNPLLHRRTDTRGWTKEQRAEHKITNGAGPPLAASGYEEADFLEYLQGAKSLAAEHGLALETVGMGGPNRAITLGLPERDAEIAAWQKMVRAMGAAGIPHVSSAAGRRLPGR